MAVALAEAQLAEAESNLDPGRTRLSIASSDVFKRKRRHASRRSRRAETTFDAAKAIQQARDAAVAAAKSAVVEAEEAIRNMFIYAPFDGTVVTKDAEKGESIMPGGMGASSGRGSVITLAKLDELEVDTDVKEDYLGQIRKGQPTRGRRRRRPRPPLPGPAPRDHPDGRPHPRHRQGEGRRSSTPTSGCSPN